MRISSSYFTMLLAIGGLLSGAANAAALQFDISTTVTVADDSYDGPYQVSDTITGTFIVDDDTANGGPGSDPGPGTNPGHEYTSFWEFNGAPYSVNLLDVQEGTSFSSDTQAVVVNDGLAITADDTGGMIPDGTYDWIEILGATTSDYCPLPGGDCSGDPNSILVADGEEWTLAIFATDDSWFTGGGIPQSLPGSYTAFLIGFDFDAVGNEIGVVLAPVDTLTVTAVPVPAAVWLFGSALAGLGWLRRKQTT
ncbi:MAG: VPLPA-CTERM sorting domain-containing protein [Gammaproteobacteria bacterium]|nr:VPLPA-CTERM sorting domain-containing protein [Gammaproteobacteria bacterium]